MPAGPERTVPEPLPAIDTNKVAPGANTAGRDGPLARAPHETIGLPLVPLVQRGRPGGDQTSAQNGVQ
jgi:hypothetical protein